MEKETNILMKTIPTEYNKSELKAYNAGKEIGYSAGYIEGSATIGKYYALIITIIAMILTVFWT